MSPRKKHVNPFYIVLVVAGLVFLLTACAYGVMAVKELRSPHTLAAQVEADASFVEFMDQHGPKAMLIELAILGVATFAAISTDRYWSGDSDE